jgi:hypothetical protein
MRKTFFNVFICVMFCMNDDAKVFRGRLAKFIF